MFNLLDRRPATGINCCHYVCLSVCLSVSFSVCLSVILAHNQPVDASVRRRHHTVAPRSAIIDNQFESGPKIPKMRSQITAFMDCLQ